MSSKGCQANSASAVVNRASEDSDQGDLWSGRRKGSDDPTPIETKVEAECTGIRLDRCRVVGVGLLMPVPPPWPEVACAPTSLPWWQQPRATASTGTARGTAVQGSPHLSTRCGTAARGAVAQEGSCTVEEEMSCGTRCSSWSRQLVRATSFPWRGICTDTWTEQNQGAALTQWINLA